MLKRTSPAGVDGQLTASSSALTRGMSEGTGRVSSRNQMELMMALALALCRRISP